MWLLGEAMATTKAYFRGTHRRVAPAETLARFAPCMRALGITRLTDVTGLDAIGLPTYVALRPTSRARPTAPGQGLDHDAAKVSALMAAIEAWHAEHAELALVHDSYRALVRRHPAADPCSLPAQPGATPGRDVPYVWARGWDLITEAWSYVPFELVTARAGFAPGYRPTFPITRNGLASGNDLLEAVSHALCEVIERDALALWSQLPAPSRQATAVALATVGDPACRHVLGLLAEAGLAVRAWDITSELDIPAYAVQICEPPDHARGRPVGPAAGFGCHLAPEVALLRALTEAVQSRLARITASRDDLCQRTSEAPGDRDDPARAWRSWPAAEGGVAFARRALDTPSFERDIALLVARLRGLGVANATVVDLSRTDLGVPVVKLVVAGLEGHDLGAAGPAAC